MLKVLLGVTAKLLVELFAVVVGVVILLLVLYVWDKTNPRHFEKTMRRLARHFR